MKKVFCGLVIALMMNGSGYADLSRDECKYLKTEAELYVKVGKVLKKENEKDYSRGENSTWARTIDKEVEMIKNAHHFAVTWSVLCD
jgi:hypothetical protein